MNTVFDINQIMKLIPHRYPFVLIDRVTEIVANERVCTYKNVTINEQFFQGHFPSMPVMPGVLIIEAMAQSSIVLVAHTLGYHNNEKVYLFTGIDKARFRRPVVPGDKLEIVCDNLRHKLHVWKMDTKAYVDGKLVAEASLTAVATDAASN